MFTSSAKNGRSTSALAAPRLVAAGTWIPYAQAVKRLGVTGGRVSQLVRQGRLRAQRNGGLLYLLVVDVERYRHYRQERRRVAELVRAAKET